MRTYLSQPVRRAVTVFLLLVSVFSVFVMTARAQQFTQTINYQGKLVNASSVAVADGIADFTWCRTSHFHSHWVREEILDHITAGRLLWQYHNAVTHIDCLVSHRYMSINGLESSGRIRVTACNTRRLYGRRQQEQSSERLDMTRITPFICCSKK